jgi:hypothetical protein
LSESLDEVRALALDGRARVAAHMGRHRVVKVPPSNLIDLYDTILQLAGMLETAIETAAEFKREAVAHTERPLPPRAPLTARSRVRP